MHQTGRLIPAPIRLLGREQACRLHDRLTAARLPRMGRAYDVVHAWPLAADLTLQRARALGALAVREAPNTHTAHAFEVVRREHERLGVPQPNNNPHTFRPSTLRRELREYELADLILAPSQFALDTFRDRGAAPDKLALKSYGFDPHRFGPPVTREGRARVVFAFVARCEPRKGLHFALQAWRDSGVADRSEFRIYGTYIPGYRPMLRALLDHPNVSEHGFADDLSSIYREADVLVLPSVEDGSALVTYEAQASGCALLVSQAAGARLTPGREGFVHAPGEVATLAQHMARLVNEPATLAAMQARAVANARRLTWDRATEDLLAVYDATIARRHGPV